MKEQFILSIDFQFTTFTAHEVHTSKSHKLLQGRGGGGLLPEQCFNNIVFMREHTTLLKRCCSSLFEQRTFVLIEQACPLLLTLQLTC